jgi:hypothetical protein
MIGPITQNAELSTQYETIQFSPHPCGAGSKNEAKIELKMQKKGKKENKSGVFSWLI